MANDIIDIVAQSSKKLVACHIGTTPFCGPIGKKFGIKCDRSAEFVPQYPDVKFLLLHSGYNFLPEGDPEHNGGKYTDICINMAKTYPNVYLSISAIFAQSPDGVMKYPGGDKCVQKMKDAGVCHKVFWGSDASYIKGQIKPVLISSIKTMINAGWTQEERTWTLRGLAKKLFGII
jgi:predicted TIM-barrel fold metal-dependent hydrolase